MNMKIINIAIIGVILLIIYFTVGSSFVEFYFGGKNTILRTAETINKRCNDKGSCPQTIEGWNTELNGILRKDKMIYFINKTNQKEGSTKNIEYQTFKLVYVMPIPDHWYEVQGGVGKAVISGWKSRK